MGRFVIALALSSLVMLAGCDKSEESTEPAAPVAVPLNPAQVGTAEARTVKPSFKLTGITEAIQSARVSPQISARVQANHFEGGEIVEQGTLLVELDPSDFEAKLGAAEAALQAARAKVKQAQANWDRAQELMPDGYISQLDYDTAEAAVETARAEVSQAEAAVEQAELNLERTRISAPFTGRISPPGHAVGDLVGPLAVKSLFELVQLDPMYVYASVKQETYNRFAIIRQKFEAAGKEVPPLAVTIELPGGDTYPHDGEFQTWDHSAEAAPGMIVARTVFPNPEGILLPGQNVTLHGRAIEAVEGVFIPQRAVLQDQQGHYVIVIDDADTLQRRNIQVGIRDGADWSVRAGLEAGERLVVQGAQRLAPGTQVTLEAASSG
jgi:membrane fusion protein (multidrug efflux system)